MLHPLTPHASSPPPIVYSRRLTYSHLKAAFTPLHHGANVQAAAAPCGGAARPAPDEGAGTQAPRPATSRQVRADLHQRCVAAPPQLVCGRVTAAQCGSGPFGTGAAGGEPPPPPSLRLPRKPQDTQESRAAELGRAADQRVPRGENGRGSMYSQQDHKTPAPGSTRGCGSHERYGRFTRKGNPSCGGIRSPGVALRAVRCSW